MTTASKTNKTVFQVSQSQLKPDFWSIAANQDSLMMVIAGTVTVSLEAGRLEWFQMQSSVQSTVFCKDFKWTVQRVLDYVAMIWPGCYCKEL